MATPKLDSIAIEFIKKIPDVFQSNFTAGSGDMPAGELLTKDQIMDYVNRALHKYFNDSWNGLAKTVASRQKLKEKFVEIFPELLGRFISIEFPLVIGVDAEYRDFYDAINGYLENDSKTFIRVWTSDKLTLIQSSKLKRYTPTEKSPVIIKSENAGNIFLEIFPDSLDGENATVNYIKFPIDPTTGQFLSQNGIFDSPYHVTRHPDIVNIAFEIYLQDTQQTE